MIITEKEILIALQSMKKITTMESITSIKNNKSLGKDGLTKEIYITFWNEVKTPLLLAIEKAYLVKQLSVSQKQAVIKLIKKKGRDKRYPQNWRPISLLYVNVKLISEAFAERLNPFMHNVVKWPNVLQKFCHVHTARFLKYVWPFYNIMHEKVKNVLPEIISSNQNAYICEK